MTGKMMSTIVAVIAAIFTWQSLAVSVRAPPCELIEQRRGDASAQPATATTCRQVRAC